jgi:Flp pilus assembly protein TadG
MRRVFQSVWQDYDASALVEGALILPVLFALVLGVFEFSFLFYQQHMISTGVHDAARYLARTGDPTDATLQTNAKTLATTGSTTGTTARVTGWNNSHVSVAVATVANPVGGVNLRIAGATSNQTITVTSTFTDPSLGFFGVLGLVAPTFTVSHVERAIRETP